MIPDLPPPHAWRKSSWSGGENGNCVEVAHVPAASFVRNTRNRSAGALRFGEDVFSSFIADVKSGQFDQIQ